MNAQTTTIQVSTINRDALLKLGELMQQNHPGIWGSQPSFNAIVGYALAQIADADQLAIEKPSR